MGVINVGEIHESLDTALRDWIAQQKVFFVGTAPLAANGLVNCSPKGMDTFRVVSEHEVVYLDLTGSGVETIAHLKENGRIVIMFCSFDAIPRILRLHGTGHVFLTDSTNFKAYRPLFGKFAGVRSIIKIEVKRIADACGYGVPEYTFKADRDTLASQLERQGEQGALEYQKAENAHSIDGLPGLGGYNCLRQGHGHDGNRCNGQRMWTLRGSTSTVGGWDVRRRTSWSTDVLGNCAVLCADCGILRRVGVH